MLFGRSSSASSSLHSDGQNGLGQQASRAYRHSSVSADEKSSSSSLVSFVYEYTEKLTYLCQAYVGALSEQYNLLAVDEARDLDGGAGTG